MYCSHYRLQKFLDLVINELEHPTMSAAELKVICIQFSLKLACEAEEQREGARASHEFYLSAHR